ncbi:D-glycero-beta-D-manno-heptose 1,7-bisphosphate 7-phosphatase [Aidingimonas halophila]|uniref:D,D-heptose 1,7-bisphosphate phosphatase n=1 Tax=Aidingimonas halophila TaxID=574349 RepID=A0A1H2XQA2_9GAMM|nr:D-glycero-beta-D-manno-heptose 1,7-bisphosphate 7-phosphatase [Aidingimonas halophila]GHC29121.1 D-glycero-beta-D-manno-heptose-1,7-bisphosphate 7-phosphatase [Aidingimonas halophila]SDW95013.1 D-alpha,beta-D-heptose 1,7-bisphosphate phosphatase [Aidingimonas halophila]
MSEKVVVLDRDGVINQDSDEYIKSLDEWVPYPQSIESIARLHQAGWQVAVATNQSGIARGFYTKATLENIHRELHRRVNIAGGELAHIAYCPHGPDDFCHCRKPQPGLLEQIQDVLHLTDFEGCWMVGDSLRDLETGAAMGCHLALVRTGKGLKTEAQGEGLEGTLIFDDLASFVDWLLLEQQNELNCR